MLRIATIVGISLLVGVAGCRTGDQKHRTGVRVEITGGLVKKPGTNEYFWVDLRKIKLGQNGESNAVIPLPTNKRVETPHILKVEIGLDRKDRDQDFDVLIGPNFSGQAAHFAVANSPELKFYVETGLAFIWGRGPIVKTQYVRISTPASASAPADDEGYATIIVEEAVDVAGAYIQRVYNVADARSEKVSIYCDTGDVVVDDLARGYFVELDGCYKKSDPVEYSTVEERRKFVEETKTRAVPTGYSEFYP